MLSLNSSLPSVHPMVILPHKVFVKIILKKKKKKKPSRWKIHSFFSVLILLKLLATFSIACHFFLLESLSSLNFYHSISVFLSFIYYQCTQCFILASLNSKYWRDQDSVFCPLLFSHHNYCWQSCPIISNMPPSIVIICKFNT